LASEKPPQAHDLIAKLSEHLPGILFQFRLFPDGHGCFPFASHGIREMFEVAPEQVLEDASPIFAVLHPEDRDDAVASFTDSARTLKPWHHEFRVVLPEQGVRWRLGDALPERLEDGSTLWHGFITDITDRKRTEEALEESEDIFRLFMEHSPIYVFFKDHEIRSIRLSRNYEKMLGMPIREILGKTMDELFPSELAKSMIEDDLQVLKGGKLIEVEEELAGRFYSTIKFPIIKQGKPPLLAGFTIDITERKSLEEQLRQAQKMEAIGQLAGGIAHDFNNLITVITGYSELLLSRYSADNPERPKIEEILKAGNRASQLTRQLLAFSRKQVLQPKVVSLNDIVAGIEKMLQRLIGENILLASVTEPRLWNVLVDPSQIEQVIMNLAVNSRDAMPHGGSLSLSTANVVLSEAFAQDHKGARPGPHALLTVRDTGCGMDEETISHIFEPFFTTKEAGKGTGLGLATVYGIVKQSGGYIALESTVGKGTTVRVYFPRTFEDSVKAREGEAFADPLTGTETVLVVEDEKSVRGLVAAVLSAKGYKVLAVGGGIAGLRYCERHKGTIDLLITDVMMPGMGGVEFSNRLKAVRPGMKVLYMSGNAEDDEIQKEVLRKGYPFLQKPFKQMDLLMKVRDVIDAGRDGMEV
jgi:PAS domain S-box-containing protein